MAETRRHTGLNGLVALDTALDSERPRANERSEDPGLGHDRSAASATSAPRAFTTRLVRDPTPSFLGRTSELERVLRSLRVASGPVVLISSVRSLPGLGKSELACKAAAELQGVLPVQLWLDLRGQSETPVRPEQALERVLRFLMGPLASLPSEPEALVSLYRHKLSGLRALIVADDAKDAACIRALLPPPGCALLATSRSRIPVHQLGSASGYAMDLDSLSATDSTLLLRSLCPRLSSSQAAELAMRCAHAPLALQIVGQLLRDDPTRQIPDVTQQLVQERAKLEMLRPAEGMIHDLLAAIGVGFRSVDPWSRRLLCRMAVLPLACDADTLQAIAALPSHASALSDVLRRLSRSGLLDLDAKAGLYRMHDLVRVYAQSQGEPGHDREVRDLHAAHITALLHQLDQRFRQGSDALTEALVHFDRLRPHIDAAQAWVTTGLHDRPSQMPSPKKPNGERSEDDIPRRYVAMAKVGGGLLALRMAAKARQRWFEGALQAAHRIADRESEAPLLLQSGHALRDQGLVPRALDVYEQCVSVARSTSDRQSELRALSSLGFVCVEQGQAARAIGYLEPGLALARTLQDRRAESAMLANLGIAYLDIGQPAQAITAFEQDLSVAQKLGDQRAEGRALGNLGLAHRASGQPQRAISYYDQHIVIARNVGDRRGEANSAWNRALALEGLGRRSEAIASAEQALRLREALGDPRAEKVRQAIEAWKNPPDASPGP